MSIYAKIDVNLPDDIAIRKAGPLAELVYVRCILLCKRLLTDGEIHASLLCDLARGLKGKPESLAAALVEVGLWEKTPSGWRIPLAKWTKWQDTKEQVERRQEATRERIRNWREKRNSNKTSERECNGVTHSFGNAAVVTDPEPDPDSDPDSDPEPDPEPFKQASKKNRFAPPGVADVAEYCRERSNGIDAAAFVDHYTANGWKIGGKSAMKDWRAAVRTWERSREKPAEKPKAARLPTREELDAWSPVGGDS